MERESIEVQDWSEVFAAPIRGFLEGVLLPKFLMRQRWFGAKAKMIETAAVSDWIPTESGAVLTLLDVSYTDGSRDIYFVPLAFLDETHFSGTDMGDGIVAVGRFGGTPGRLTDATLSEPFLQWILSAIGGYASNGLVGVPGKALKVMSL